MTTPTAASATSGEVPFKVFLHRSKEQTFHRFRGTYSFAQFQTVVGHLWGTAPKSLMFEYTDDEGDQIRITSENEWTECLRIWSVKAQPEMPVRVQVRRNRREEKHHRNARKQEAESELEVDNSTIVVEPVVPEVEIRSTSAVPTLPDINILASRTALDIDSPLKEQDVVVEEEEEEEEAMISNEDPETPTITQPQQSEQKADVPNLQFESPEHRVVMDLLSLVFGCDAAAKLMCGNEGIFAPVVKRMPDPYDPSEVHLDIDRNILYQRAVQRANSLLDGHQYVAAEEMLRTALSVYQDSMLLEYNLACALSLQGKAEEGLEFLRLAMLHGYDNIQHMKADPDLVNVRALTDFASLLPTPHSAPATVATPRTSPKEKKEEKVVVDEKVDESLTPAVRTILSVFPTITVDEAKVALVRAAGNVSVAVNNLLGRQF